MGTLRFMVLQAYIDDSYDGEVFTLGGYMATAEKWIEFSRSWQSLLDVKNIRNTKIKNMRHIFGKERMNYHLSPFVDLIEEYLEYEISFCINVSVFQKACQEYSLLKRDRNPYFLGWNAIVSRLTDVVLRNGLSDGIEFIFDNQSEKRKINDAWENLLKTAPTNHKKFIKNSPIFRDDDKFLPLQAADICAWHSRIFFREHNFVLSDGCLFPWRNLNNYPDAIRISMTERNIRKTAKRLMRIRQYPFRSSFSLFS